MIKGLFIGGPWDGRVESLPDDTWNWEVPDWEPVSIGFGSLRSTTTYRRVRYKVPGSVFNVFYVGDIARAEELQTEIFCALVKLAGLSP